MTKSMKNDLRRAKRIITRATTITFPPEPERQYNLPTVNAMYEEMKRVALSELKPTLDPAKLDQLLRFTFMAGYSHSLQVQMLLQTNPGPVADRITITHAAETISHIKSFRTYHLNKPLPLPEVNGKETVL